MNKSRRVGLAACAVPLWFVALGATAPKAGPSPSLADTASETPTVVDVAAQAMAHDEGIGVSVATSRIQSQAAQADLVDQVSAQYPQFFAGAWVDQSDGSLVLTFTNAPSAAVRLASEQTFPTIIKSGAIYTEADLLAKQADLSEVTADAPTGPGMHWTSFIDVRANQLVLTVPLKSNQAVKALSTETAALNGEDPDSIRTVRKKESAVVTQLSCNDSYVSCDPPVRGGVRIRGEYSIYNGRGYSASFCTSGFVTESNLSSNRYMVTAGHCLSEYSSSGSTWYSYNSTPYIFDIGTQTIYNDTTSGDYGAFHISAVSSEPGIFIQDDQNPPASATRTTSYSITGSASAVAGQYLCKAGYVGHTACGQVISSDSTTPNGLLHSLYISLIGSDHYACPGDSGGPIVANNRAYGLVIQGNPFATVGSCFNSYYAQKIGPALSGMNLHLYTA